MKIVHVISSIDPRFGGPSAAIVRWSKAQKQAGHDVRLIATWQQRAAFPVAEWLQSAGVVTHLVGPSVGKLARHRDLLPTLDAAIADADVVHVHGLWEEIQHQSARLARRHQVPYVVTPYGMIDDYAMRKHYFRKHAYLWWRGYRDLNKAAALHYACDLEEFQARRLRLRPPRLVEPLGIDMTEYRDLGEIGRFRKNHPVLGTRRYVMFLGRLHHGKGWQILISAFAAADLKDAALVLAGPDSNGGMSKAKSLAREHRIEERVLFTGLLGGPDKFDALRDAYVFALPSDRESFGIAIIEALAVGCPVIVSDQVNIHPDISAADVGTVVPLDVGALSNALQRYFGDEQLRNQRSIRAQPFAENYSWENIARRWDRRYEQLRVRRKGIAEAHG